MKFADAFIIRKFLAAKSCHNKEANSDTLMKYDCSKRRYSWADEILLDSLLESSNSRRDFDENY